eukprot:PhF_6_TR44449/c0_g1_i1/m.68422
MSKKEKKRQREVAEETSSHDVPQVLTAAVPDYVVCNVCHLKDPENYLPISGLYFRCDECDYDLCKKCHDVSKHKHRLKCMGAAPSGWKDLSTEATPVAETTSPGGQQQTKRSASKKQNEDAPTIISYDTLFGTFSSASSSAVFPLSANGVSDLSHLRRNVTTFSNVIGVPDGNSSVVFALCSGDDDCFCDSFMCYVLTDGNDDNRLILAYVANTNVQGIQYTNCRVLNDEKIEISCISSNGDVLVFKVPMPDMEGLRQSPQSIEEKGVVSYNVTVWSKYQSSETPLRCVSTIATEPYLVLVTKLSVYTLSVCPTKMVTVGHGSLASILQSYEANSLPLATNKSTVAIGAVGSTAVRFWSTKTNNWEGSLRLRSPAMCMHWGDGSNVIIACSDGKVWGATSSMCQILLYEAPSALTANYTVAVFGTRTKLFVMDNGLSCVTATITNTEAAILAHADSQAGRRTSFTFPIPITSGQFGLRSDKSGEKIYF